jgi:hypothetical protein
MLGNPRWIDNVTTTVWRGCWGTFSYGIVISLVQIQIPDVRQESHPPPTNAQGLNWYANTSFAWWGCKETQWRMMSRPPMVCTRHKGRGWDLWFNNVSWVSHSVVLYYVSRVRSWNNSGDIAPSALPIQPFWPGSGLGSTSLQSSLQTTVSETLGMLSVMNRGGDNSCVSVSGTGKMSSLTQPLSTHLIPGSAVHFGPCVDHSVRSTLEHKGWVPLIRKLRLQCILRCQSPMVVTFRAKGSVDLRTQNHLMSLPPCSQSMSFTDNDWRWDSQVAHVHRDIGEGGGQGRSTRCLLVLENSLQIQKEVRLQSTQTAAHRSKYRDHWP